MYIPKMQILNNDVLSGNMASFDKDRASHQSSKWLSIFIHELDPNTDVQDNFYDLDHVLLHLERTIAYKLYYSCID